VSRQVGRDSSTGMGAVTVASTVLTVLITVHATRVHVIHCQNGGYKYHPIIEWIAVFDPALLRTFVAVAETLSFTRAAELLGLSQPTVSQQIRKLEIAAGRTLVTRDTRAVALTDNGDAMLGFARSILAAHDQAAAYFTGTAMRGRIRFGSAD